MAEEVEVEVEKEEQGVGVYSEKEEEEAVAMEAEAMEAVAMTMEAEAMTMEAEAMEAVASPAPHSIKKIAFERTKISAMLFPKQWRREARASSSCCTDPRFRCRETPVASGPPNDHHPSCA